MVRIRLCSLALIISLALLSSCAPQTRIQDNVVPIIYSIIPAEKPGDTVLIQGRYFGDGQQGMKENSYVILGADISAQGGVRISPTSWTPTRISFPMPEGVGYGFVFVVVEGKVSSGLPANLP